MKTFDLNRFMVGDKIKVWPAKKEAKLAVLNYLASKFESDKFYTEKEVNEILNNFHTFEDHAFLRRELFDNFLINRDPDGSRYWRD